MNIKIVMGPPCAGKSTFIKENFPDYKVIDLFDFQKNIMNYDEIMQSYLDCRDALIEALKNNENVVLEHTLLKKKRRKMYVDAIRSITDADIEIYVACPKLEDYIERSKKRKTYISDENLKYYLDFMDFPDEDEGFSKIFKFF